MKIRVVITVQKGHISGKKGIFRVESLSLTWEPFLFESKRERSLNRFGSHFVHNGKANGNGNTWKWKMEIPFSAE